MAQALEPAPTAFQDALAGSWIEAEQPGLKLTLGHGTQLKSTAL